MLLYSFKTKTATPIELFGDSDQTPFEIVSTDGSERTLIPGYYYDGAGWNDCTNPSTSCSMGGVVAK